MIPIFKSAERNKLNNYRPISMLPYFSKFFKEVMQTSNPSEESNTHCCRSLFTRAHSSFLYNRVVNNGRLEKRIIIECFVRERACEFTKDTEAREPSSIVSVCLLAVTDLSRHCGMWHVALQPILRLM